MDKKDLDDLFLYLNKVINVSITPKLVEAWDVSPGSRGHELYNRPESRDFLTVHDFEAQVIMDEKLQEFGIPVGSVGEESHPKIIEKLREIGEHDPTIEGLLDRYDRIQRPRKPEVSILSDMIDGTRIFLNKGVKWTTGSAIIQDGETKGAIVYWPLAHRMFWALEGIHGAHMAQMFTYKNIKDLKDSSDKLWALPSSFLGEKTIYWVSTSSFNGQIVWPKDTPLNKRYAVKEDITPEVTWQRLFGQSYHGSKPEREETLKWDRPGSGSSLLQLCLGAGAFLGGPDGYVMLFQEAVDIAIAGYIYNKAGGYLCMSTCAHDQPGKPIDTNLLYYPNREKEFLTMDQRYHVIGAPNIENFNMILDIITETYEMNQPIAK